MARGIQWEWVNPIAADRNLAQNAFNSTNQGISAIAQAVGNYGNAVRDQNTQGIITEAMGINSLADLQEGRRGVLASLQAAGNGADATKVMSALQQQERALYDKQNNINQLEDRSNRLSDLAVMRDPNVIAKALAGDAASLQALSQMNDGSPLVSAYIGGRNHAEGNARDARDFAVRQEERTYQRGQDAINNNFRRESANLTLSNALNPNPSQQTTTYVDDGQGGFTEVITESPSLAETYSSVSRNRRADGSIDWGTISTPTVPVGTGKGSKSSNGYAAPVQRAVAANLTSLSRNLQSGEFGQAARRTGVHNNPKVLAMAAIESGGGNMSSNSGQAVGPMQLNTRYYKGNEVKNIDDNIRKGASEIARLDKKFGGNTDAIAIAYNGGDNAADVAYKAWNAAGKRGRVADYIPSTYQSNGKTKQYDVAQMRSHAYKYDLALGYLGNNTTGGNQSKTTKAQAPRSNFSLGNGVLATAQQGFSNTLRGTELDENSKARSGGSKANETALQMYLDDQKINKNGGILNSALRDSQSVYTNLTKNPAYNSLPAKDQKEILSKAVKYNADNQGWLGRNVNSDTQAYRTNQEIDTLIQSKRDAHEETNFKNLRTAAQSLIKNEQGRKGRKGPLPTIDQAMNMINPRVYAAMKQKDKMIDSPFQ